MEMQKVVLRWPEGRGLVGGNAVTAGNCAPEQGGPESAHSEDGVEVRSPVESLSERRRMNSQKFMEE